MDKLKNQSQAHRYLNFSLGLENYALPLATVKEVIAVPEIRPVPHALAHFLGIMNLRGEMIPVIDLRLKLGIKIEPSQEATVIICDLAQYSLGMVVSSVNCVLALDESNISSTPEIHSTRKTDYILGVAQWDNKLVLLLDISKALDAEEHTSLNGATEFKAA